MLAWPCAHCVLVNKLVSQFLQSEFITPQMNTTVILPYRFYHCEHDLANDIIWCKKCFLSPNIYKKKSLILPENIWLEIFSVPENKLIEIVCNFMSYNSYFSHVFLWKSYKQKKIQYVFIMSVGKIRTVAWIIFVLTTILIVLIVGFGYLEMTQGKIIFWKSPWQHSFKCLKKSLKIYH